MAVTKVFKNGNSQAARIRPPPRRLEGVLSKFAAFSPDFMAQGRGDNCEAEREDP